MLCVCVAVFPPWCIFIIIIVLFFSLFFFFNPVNVFGRGFRICFMTVDFTPGGLSPGKTQRTGYLTRTSYGFPGASGKWELLQSWRSPSFLSLVLQVGAWSAARQGCSRCCRCWRPRLLLGRRAPVEPGEFPPTPHPAPRLPPLRSDCDLEAPTNFPRFKLGW